MDDLLFRFEFIEEFHINAVVLRCDSFSKAIVSLKLMMGEHILDYVISIHKIM